MPFDIMDQNSLIRLRLLHHFVKFQIRTVMYRSKLHGEIFFVHILDHVINDQNENICRQKKNDAYRQKDLRKRLQFGR